MTQAMPRSSSAPPNLTTGVTCPQCQAQPRLSSEIISHQSNPHTNFLDPLSTKSKLGNHFNHLLQVNSQAC